MNTCYIYSDNKMRRPWCNNCYRRTIRQVKSGVRRGRLRPADRRADAGNA